MNIFQKLIEVRKSVPYLKKDTAGYQFKYVSSSQTLGALREAMDDNALLLIPRVMKWEIRDHTTRKGDHEYFSILDMEFTWVNAENPDETVTCPFMGCGLDDGEKGIGKAVTYAEKYFLLKFFNVPTDKDDPDSFQKQTGEKKEEKRTLPPPPSGKTPSREEGQYAQGVGDDPEYQMRREIHEMGMFLSTGDSDEYSRIVQRITSFKDFPGYDNIDKAKGTPLRIAHGKIKKEYNAAMKARADAHTELVPPEESAAAQEELRRMQEEDKQAGLPF